MNTELVELIQAINAHTFNMGRLLNMSESEAQKCTIRELILHIGTVNLFTQVMPTPPDPTYDSVDTFAAEVLG